MKAKSIILVVILFLALSFSYALADVPQMINYQGKLTTPTGTLVDTTVSMLFSIYADSSGGTALWSETHSSIEVQYGVFNVLLGGETTPIPDSVFDGSVRYLGIKVGTDSEMSPRKAIVSVGYAFHSGTAQGAEFADTAAYALTAAGVGDTDWSFRITDTADTTLMTGGEWGIARAGNVLYGNEDSTHVNLGVACTTGASGMNYSYCTVGGGHINVASHGYSTIAGGLYNTASSNGATVAGGVGNTASGLFATVGGGVINTASGNSAIVLGGCNDSAGGDYSMVAGRDVKVTGNHSFGFGRDFTTSTANAIIFSHPSDSTVMGINVTNPTYAVHLPNNANNSGRGMANAWNTYSSIRWKKNIKQIEHPLDKVMALRGVYFDWKEGNKRDVGLIAEEVGEVLPEVVNYEENGIDAEGLDYSRLTALLVEAVKEQQEMVKGQQKEIELLKKKIEILEKGVK